MKRLSIIITLVLVAVTSVTAQKRYTDLPTLYIDTAYGQPIESKEEYIDCKVTRVDDSGTTVYDDGTIRGRGNSTWLFGDKKPYRLKFKEKKKFLGPDRANAKSWVLLANSFDKTLLRNAVASQIGTICGQEFTVGAEFVDVVLNGKYIGTYQITDQVDIRKKRINIHEMDVEVPESENYTGGYLLECDGLARNEPVYFYTPQGAPIVVKSPDENVIGWHQIQYITEHFAKFENALFSKDFTDPVRGYRQYVDSLSLASWYIATELTANPDCFWSTYMYKERDDDHIFFGPMWDYDIAFNNCHRKGDIGDRLMAEVAYNYYDQTGMWVNRMYYDPWFRALLSREWTRIVDSGIENRIVSYIDSMAVVVDKSQRLNYAVYPIDEMVHDELVLFSSYIEGIEFLKNAFRNRFPLLNKAFAYDPSVTPPSPNDTIKPITKASYPKPGYYYSIHSAKTDKAVGFDGDGNLVQFTVDSIANRPEFHWQIIPVDDPYVETYRLINRSTGMAATHFEYNTAVGLTDTLKSDYSNQYWKIIPASDDEDDPFVIIESRNYPFAWNNYSGYETDNNPVISWTSDERNFVSANRQWAFSLIEEIEPGKGDDDDDDKNALDTPHCDYAVTYSAAESAIHFIIYGDEEMHGTMEIYSLSGQLLMNRTITPTVSVAELRPGTYMLRWTLNGQQPRTIKFIR